MDVERATSVATLLLSCRELPVTKEGMSNECSFKFKGCVNCIDKFGMAVDESKEEITDYEAVEHDPQVLPHCTRRTCWIGTFHDFVLGRRFGRSLNLTKTLRADGDRVITGLDSAAETSTRH